MAWFFLVCLVFIPNLLNGVCADSAGDHVAIKAFVETLNKTIADPECLASWDTDDCCKWNKIECNTENRVVRMDLGNCNLSGVLVPQLGNLDNLTVMNLYSNALRGPILPELSNLASLKYLALQENRFEGLIPPDLAYLNNLKYLKLQENNLNGSVPQSLADKIPGMSQVDLTKNNGLSGPCTKKACP